MRSNSFTRACSGITVAVLGYYTLSTAVSLATARYVRADSGWRPDIWFYEVYDPGWLPLVFATLLVVCSIKLKPAPLNWAIPLTLPVACWSFEYFVWYDFVVDECQLQMRYAAKPMLFGVLCLWSCGMAVGLLRRAAAKRSLEEPA